MLLKRTSQFIIISLVVATGYYFYTQVQGAGTIGKTTTPTGLEDGLVGHWTFDGPDMVNNVADVSGNGRHATLYYSNATTTFIGKIGQALNFDGIGDHILAGGVNTMPSPFRVVRTVTIAG